MLPTIAIERLHAFVSRNITDPETANMVIGHLDMLYGSLQRGEIKFSKYKDVQESAVKKHVDSFFDFEIDNVVLYSCEVGVFRPLSNIPVSIFERLHKRPWHGVRLASTLVTLLEERHKESLWKTVGHRRWNEMYDLLNDPFDGSVQGKTVDRLYNLLRNSLGPAFPITAISEVRHAIFHPIAFWLAAQIAQDEALIKKFNLIIGLQFEAPMMGPFLEAPGTWTAITF